MLPIVLAKNLGGAMTPLKSLFTLTAAVLLVGSTSAQQLAPNQTNGFGNNRLVTFTYLQNFDCVDEPTLEAQSDPAEMQTPICQPITEPTQDPTGGDIKHTAHLYVFLPMFFRRQRSESERCHAVPEWRKARRTLRSLAGQGSNLAVRLCARSLEGEGESGHHDSMS
jgi:hypothetical protein